MNRMGSKSDETPAARELLFAGAPSNTYAILDGASIEGLLPRLHDLDRDRYACLLRGALSPDLEEAAPYLVRIEGEDAITTWLLEEGFGNHWGVFARSEAGLRTLHRHLRTFLMVRGPEENFVYFRYYDPRVLRVYLPTCTAEEARMVFGPIEIYLAEARNERRLLAFVESGYGVATPGAVNADPEALAEEG